MKTRILFSALILAAALPSVSVAGTLFYVPVPATGSDAQSGIESAKIFTSAITAGKTKAAGRTLNGVAFGALTASGNSVTASGVTVSATTGSLANGGGKADSIQADGAMADLLSGMIFNEGAADNSEQYVVLDPASLTAGKTYDLRVYVCNASGENRQVSLSFAGDGKPSVSTDFFNEDDATTSAGGFIEPNQVYYINYRFTWDGVNTPGFTATQRFGSTPFCLYALTNQEVGNDPDARPAGAVVATEPEPIAAPPSSRSRTGANLVESEDIGIASEVFYSSDSLRRHGRWVTVGSYGRCWQPTGLDDDWQPYTRGHWVHSQDDGWVWDSDEDFGWATYHYGRWFREEGSGWYWVPGRVWAPAWVSWRHGHSYVGWAALPPAAIAVAGLGISSWADHRWGIGPRAYNFVNVRDFGAPSMARVLLPRTQNAAVMTNTNNVTNIVNGRRGIYNGGPSFQAVNNALGRTGSPLIPSVRVNRNAGNRPVTPDGKFSQLTAGVLALTAPSVTRNKKSGPLPPVAATIAAPKIDKGWTGLADPKNATVLQAKIANETPGQTAKNAPARLPGTLPFTPGGAGSKAGGSGKSSRPGRPTDATFPKPGQPVGAALVKPGQPGPTAGAPPGTTLGKGGNLKKPGQPATAPAGVAPTLPGQPVPPTNVATPQPGQPLPPTAGKGNKRGKGPKSEGIPVPQPAQPVIPAPVTPPQPTPPGSPSLIVPPKPGQPVKPADAPIANPAKAGTPGKGAKSGQPAPVIPVAPAPVKLTEPVPVKPAPVPPAPESMRGKKRTAPATPPVPASVPGKPAVPAATAPEPNRPKKRASQPEPSVPAPVKPAIPPPTVQKAAPVVKPAPKPAPVAPKPVAPVVPPQPARQVPRPAPPVAAPAKPAVSAPAAGPNAPSKKGGKPTPTPTPAPGAKP